MLTAGTLHKAHLFREPKSLDMLQDVMFNLCEEYRIERKAWALFSNHYHLVFVTYEDSRDLAQFICHLHSASSRLLNKLEQKPGRRVWYQFWDTQLTYRDSYYARINYVNNNPVKHGLVSDARLYPWCSATWFKENHSAGHVRTVTSYKTDTVNVIDEF